MTTIDQGQGAEPAVQEAKPNAIAVEREVKAAQLAHAAGVPGYAMPRTLQDLRNLGEIFYASGMFKDLKSAAQAIVKIAGGAAIGYDPVSSMSAFHLFDGKITPTAGEIRARIKRAGYRLKEYEIDAKGDRVDPIKPHAEVNGAVVIIREKVDGVWEDLEPAVFTKQDSITAGLSGKDNWKKYAKAMYSARALTIAARKHCSEVFGGPVYTPEELGADVELDSEGEMVIVSAPAAPPADDRKAPTGAEIKALYADARKLDPSLPEKPTEWAAGAVEGFVNPPTVAMVVALRAKLEQMLADGAPVAQAEPAVEGEYQEPPAPAGDAPAPSTGKMTAAQRGMLFALMGELGLKEKPEQMAWMEQQGVVVKSRSEITFEQARALIDVANADAGAIRSGQNVPDGLFHGEGECAACGVTDGKRHAGGCPEA